MPPKGKWAQGITPRHFNWIIQDQLAICERPGGYGANHRKVRRQEEIIWVREQGFAPVVSIIPANHNLHNYDELGVTWVHWPFPIVEDYPRYISEHFPEIRRLLADGKKVLIHHEELADRTIGLVAAYLVWAGLVPEEPKAVFLVEHITSRQLGPQGREIVAAAGKLAPGQLMTGAGDRIELRGLRVLAYCGVLPEEQARRQPFSIDLDLACDLAAAGRSDDLADTADYGAVCAEVERLAVDGRFALLERFAQAIADVVLQHDIVTSVTVSVAKLRPPVPQDLASSGVRITRARGGPGSAVGCS